MREFLGLRKSLDVRWSKIFFVLLIVGQVSLAQQDPDVTNLNSSRTDDGMDFVLEQQHFHVALPIWVPGFRGSFAYGGITHYPENGNPDIGEGITDSELSIEFYLIGRIRFEHQRFFVQADGFNTVLGSDLTFYDKEWLELNGTIKGTILRGMAGYAVFTKTDRDRHLRWSLHAYAGARHYILHLYTENRDILDIRPSWTDPVIGFRLPVVYRKWIFEGEVDFGGFGINNRRSWFAQTGAYYRFSRLFTLGAGWTFLDFEGEKNIDVNTMFLGMQLTGPTLTAQFSF